jgi:hypothetical protein
MKKCNKIGTNFFVKKKRKKFHIENVEINVV